MTNFKNMTDGELYGMLKDLDGVIAAQEAMVKAGNHAPKLGQYVDELYAVLAEIKMRQEALVSLAYHVQNKTPQGVAFVERFATDLWQTLNA